MHEAADWQAMLFPAVIAFFAQHTSEDEQLSFWHRSHWKTLHFTQRRVPQQTPADSGGGCPGQLYGLDASTGTAVSFPASVIGVLASASVNVTSGTLEHPSIVPMTRESARRTPSD